MNAKQSCFQRYIYLFDSPAKKLVYRCLLFQVFAIKEGVSYRIRIDFMVQREIVHGLKYLQKTKRVGLTGTVASVTTHNVHATPSSAT